nr:MAG TPA: hypothetical protein [Caudoviricetes sp.]
MKDIVLSVGSGKLIEHDGAKVFFYLTKDYLVRVSFDQDNGIVREYVEREHRNCWDTFEADLSDIRRFDWEGFDETFLPVNDEADMFYELFAEISLGVF